MSLDKKPRFRHRVSFNNLYTDIIDPDKPRYLPKFIVKDDPQLPNNQNHNKSNNNDGSLGVPKPQKLDLSFGYDVSKSSSYYSPDPSKFFKFNDFGFVNQNDRFYNDLQNKKNFTEATLKRQKLKREKLPGISKDKSILKKPSTTNNGIPTLSSLSQSQLHPHGGNQNNHTTSSRRCSSNSAANNASYSNPNPISFSSVYNKYKSEDQDAITFRNTQLNINLDPNFIPDTFASQLSQTAGAGSAVSAVSAAQPVSTLAQPPNKRKKLIDMTDEEILQLDDQFKLYSSRQSGNTSRILNDLENSIEFSKFKVLTNNLSQNDDHHNPQFKTKYSKEGVNLTNFYNKTYPSRPVVNYRSFVLHSQHENFEKVVNHNACYTYLPKDVVSETLGSKPTFSALDPYLLLESRVEVNDIDPTITPNKTLMAYISGRKHTWNSLRYLFDHNNLLTNGDTLIVFTVIPHDFELIEELLSDAHLLKFSNTALQHNDHENKDHDNGLVRYKTTSMLDDLNSYNLRKMKTNNSANPPSPNHSSTTHRQSHPPPYSASRQPTKSPVKPHSEARSQSLIDHELQKMRSYSNSNTNIMAHINKKKPLTTNEKRQIICNQIKELANRLMRAIEKLALERDIVIRITLEICFDKVLHSDLDNNESDLEEEHEVLNYSNANSTANNNNNHHPGMRKRRRSSSRRNSNYFLADEEYLDYSPYSDKSNFDSIAKVSSNNENELSRTASHNLRLERDKRRRRNPKLNLKFVIENVIKVYNPLIFVIGSKNDDELLHSLHGASNTVSNNVDNGPYSASGSGRSSTVSSRKQSMVDFGDPNFVYRSPNATSVGNTTTNSSSPSNNSSSADLAVATRNKLLRINSNDSYFSLANSNHNWNSDQKLGSPIGQTKLKFSEFLVKNTNLSVLVIPTGLMSHYGSKKYTNKGDVRERADIHSKHNWVIEWDDQLYVGNYGEENGFDDDYDDDDSEFASTVDEDVSGEGAAKLSSTKHNDDDKLGEMLDNFKTSISRVVSSTTTNNNVPQLLQQQLQLAECPEDFFSKLLSSSSDKSQHESLNFLKNSQFNYHDKTLPPTTRTRRILLKHLDNELTKKKTVGTTETSTGLDAALANANATATASTLTNIHGGGSGKPRTRSENAIISSNETSEADDDVDDDNDDDDSDDDDVDYDRPYFPKNQSSSSYYYDDEKRKSLSISTNTNGSVHRQAALDTFQLSNDDGHNNNSSHDNGNNNDNLTSQSLVGGSPGSPRGNTPKIQFADPFSSPELQQQQQQQQLHQQNRQSYGINGSQINNYNGNGNNNASLSVNNAGKPKGYTYRELLSKTQSNVSSSAVSTGSTNYNKSRSPSAKSSSFFSRKTSLDDGGASAIKLKEKEGEGQKKKGSIFKKLLRRK